VLVFSELTQSLQLLLRCAGHRLFDCTPRMDGQTRVLYEHSLTPGLLILMMYKAVTGLATFSARIVIYLMLIRRAGT